MILTDEKLNLSRQLEFDYVKALAIFGMVIIHIYEELSAADCEVICSGFLDSFIQFFGGPMAAPVFMASMGVGMVYSRNTTPKLMVRRGISLFLMGYALSFVRDVIPYFIGEGLDFGDEFWFLFLNVDILQFAGLSFLLAALLKRIKVPALGLGAIAIGMQILGQILSTLIAPESEIARCLFGLFFYTGYESCFPLLSWFVYPALGIILAKYLRHVADTDRFYRFLFGVSVTFIIGFCASLYFGGYDLRSFYALADDIYYKQNFISLIFCSLWILIELSAVHFLLAKFKPVRLTKYAKYMSSKLNNIYIAQWILIGWTGTLLYLEVVPELPVALVIPVGILYLAAAVGLVALKDRIRKAGK